MSGTNTAQEWIEGKPPRHPQALLELVQRMEQHEFAGDIVPCGPALPGHGHHWLMRPAAVDGPRLADAVTRWLLVFGSQAESQAGRKPEPPDDFTEVELEYWDGFDDEEVPDGQGGWIEDEGRVLESVYDIETCGTPGFGKRCVNPDHLRMVVDPDRYREYVDAIRHRVNAWHTPTGVAPSTELGSPGAIRPMGGRDRTDDCPLCDRRHDEPIPAMAPGKAYIVTYFGGSGGSGGNRRRVECEYVGIEPDEGFPEKPLHRFRMLGPIVDIVTGVVHASGLDPETGKFRSLKGSMLGLWHEDISSITTLRHD